MDIVTVKNKFQIVIPQHVRELTHRNRIAARAERDQRKGEKCKRAAAEREPGAAAHRRHESEPALGKNNCSPSIV